MHYPAVAQLIFLHASDVRSAEGFIPQHQVMQRDEKQDALVPLGRLSICFLSNLQRARQKHSAIMAP